MPKIAADEGTAWKWGEPDSGVCSAGHDIGAGSGIPEAAEGPHAASAVEAGGKSKCEWSEYEWSGYE